ncbi:hypothetical protein Q3G72_004914 [Acer saccharum]|nr:hypothetical protein Q3G72_004914 [Acer saccharum]
MLLLDLLVLNLSQAFRSESCYGIWHIKWDILWAFDSVQFRLLLQGTCSSYCFLRAKAIGLMNHAFTDQMRDATICFQIRQNAKLPSIQSGTTRQKFNQCKVQSATLIKANDSIKLELKFGIGNVFMVTGGGNRGTCWNFETIQAREIIVNFHTWKNILFLYRR